MPLAESLKIPALETAQKRLERIFANPDFRRAHREAVPVLQELGSEYGLLPALVRGYVLSGNFAEETRINPVVAIPMLESTHFHLVANIWIPRADGRTDISHQSIHHHGNLLLTSLAAFGPGYESFVFRREPDGTMKLTQEYVNTQGKTEFIDAGVPHLVFYPSAVSVTYALWSKDRPYSLSRFRAAPEPLKRLARRILGKLSSSAGFNQAADLDFTVAEGKIVKLPERVMYPRGGRDSLLSALRLVATEIGLKEPEVWDKLGAGGTDDFFDPQHEFVPHANLLRSEVLACFP